LWECGLHPPPKKKKEEKNKRASSPAIIGNLCKMLEKM